MPGISIKPDLPPEEHKAGAVLLKEETPSSVTSKLEEGVSGMPDTVVSPTQYSRETLASPTKSI